MFLDFISKIPAIFVKFLRSYNNSFRILLETFSVLSCCKRNFYVNLISLEYVRVI